MIEVKVAGLVQDKLNRNLWVVLLEDPVGEKILPIWIGPFEANAIAMELSNQTAPRPLTHDLIKRIIDAFQAEFSWVLINNLKDNTYYATICFNHLGKEIKLDARPSDSIAVALKFNAPIFVAKSVMDKAGVKAVGTGEEKKKGDEWIDDLLDEIQSKYLKDQGK